jgi:hypothetical protein
LLLHKRLRYTPNRRAACSTAVTVMLSRMSAAQHHVQHLLKRHGFDFEKFGLIGRQARWRQIEAKKQVRRFFTTLFEV